MRVHWTATAEGHLDAIYAYIAQDSPEYARRMADRLTRRSQQIAKAKNLYSLIEYYARIPMLCLDELGYMIPTK